MDHGTETYIVSGRECITYHLNLFSTQGSWKSFECLGDPGTLQRKGGKIPRNNNNGITVEPLSL